MNMPPRWGYGCVAPLGLWMCRPAGAMDMPPRWGYGYADPLGLWIWRPAGAMDMASRWGYGYVASMGLWPIALENAEPRRGDLSIERREMILDPAPAGRHIHSPSGALHP